jgi:hypothetical protein
MELATSADSMVTDADGVVIGCNRAQIHGGPEIQDYDSISLQCRSEALSITVKVLENSSQLGYEEYVQNLQVVNSLLSRWKPEHEPNTWPTKGLV